MVSLITYCLDFDFDFVTSCFTNFVKTFQVMSRKKRMEDIVQKKQLISEEMLRIVTISEIMLNIF